MSVTPEDIEKHLQTPEAQQPDLGLSIDYGSRKNPDQFAQDYSHAKELGLPVDTAERQRGEALRLKTLRDIGVPDEIAKKNPATAQYLSDPNAAAMSFDEINGLKSYEQILKERDTNLIANTMRLAGNRVNALTGNLIEFTGRVSEGFDDYMRELGVPSPGITIGKDGISFYKNLPREKRTSLVPLGQGISEADAYDYVPMFTWEKFKGDMTPTNLAGYIFEQGLGGSVPDMLGAVYTLPAYLMSRTEEFAEARAKNKGLEEPGAQELGEGIIPAVTVSLLEHLAGRIVLSKGGVTSVASAGVKALEAAGTEAGTEFVQTGVEYLGERVGTGANLDAMDALDQMIAGAVAGGGVGGGIRGTTATYEVIAGKARAKSNNRMDSVLDQQVIDQTITFAQSSTTRQRSKEHFEQFMEAVGKDRNVLIPAENIPAELIPSLSEETRNSLNDAITTGTDVEMPLSEFASNIATNPELIDAIRPYIKLDNANRLSQNELASDDRSDLDKLIKKAQQEKDLYDDARMIFDDVKEQLVSTGIQSETTARYSAQLYPAFASVLVQKARKAGDTEFGVLDAYDMMGLKIMRSATPKGQPNTIYDQKGRRVISDKMGKPMRVYRGQHGAIIPGQPIQTKSGSITFTHSPATASAYAEVPNQQMEPQTPHVLGAYVSIEKPWINDQSGDPFVEVSKITDALGFDRAKHYANKYFEQIMDTNNWEEHYDAKYGAVNEVPDAELGDLYLQAYHLLDDPEFIAELKKAGYDGAIYGGSGESALETEFRIFDESQIVWDKPKNQYGWPQGTPVIVSEPWSDVLDLAPGQLAVEWGTIVDSIDPLRSLVNFGDGEQREVYNQYIDPAEDKMFFQSADNNGIGLYSSVEKAINEMNLPNWKRKTEYHEVLKQGEVVQRFDTQALMDKWLEDQFKTISEPGTELAVIEQSFQDYYETRSYEATMPESGKAILQKLRSSPGVKNVELEYSGVIEYLGSKGPKGKFTRDEVAKFIEENGVKVDVVYAKDKLPEDTEVEYEDVPDPDWEPEYDASFNWDQSVDEDSDNWSYRVDDYMYEYDRSDLSDIGDLWFISEEDYLEQIDEDIQSMREKYEEDLDLVSTEEANMLARVDRAEAALAMGDAQLELPEIEGVDWEQELEDATTALREYFHGNRNLRDWVEEQASEAAEQEYMDNPIYEWYDSNTGITIRGNDDYGYRATTSSRVIVEDVYSFSEAEDEARSHAYDYDLWEYDEDERPTIRQPSQRVPDHLRTHWGERRYNMSGEYTNYREAKMVLPNIRPYYYSPSAHNFPDENIVSFMRINDRKLVVAPGKVDEKRKAELLEKAHDSIIKPEFIDFTDDFIPDTYYLKIPENESKIFMSKVRARAQSERELNAEGLYTRIESEGDRLWEGLTPEQRKEYYTAGYESYIADFTETSPEGVKADVYHIDEFQSDWHSAGLKNGYKTGADVNEMQKQINDIIDKLDDEADEVIKWIEKRTGLIKQYKEDEYFITFNDSYGDITESYRSADSIRSLIVKIIKASPEGGPFKWPERQAGLRYEAQQWVDTLIAGLNEFDHAAGKTWHSQLLAELSNRDQLEHLIQVENYGVPDAPFKGDDWIALGLKRAVLDAIENGYTHITWPNTAVLAERWSYDYAEMYQSQYMEKMTGFFKKHLKVDPIHFDMQGNPTRPVLEDKQKIRNAKLKAKAEDNRSDWRRYDNFNFGEQGYWAVEITPKMRDKILKDGFTLMQEARASIQFTVDDQSIIRLSRASDLSSFLHETGHLFLETEKRFAEKFGVSAEMQPLLDWLGVDSFDQMTVEHHEKFAETFEVYLREGKAPSLKLRDAFAAFARWLSMIYRKLTDPRLTRAQLTPEIKEYMDRMLATEAEIEQAMANPAYEQFFESQQAAGMTKREWDEYQERREKVKNRAMDDVLQTAIDELRKRESKKWKEEKAPLVQEEMERLKKEPVYQILGDLSLPEGKLDWDMLQEEIGFDKHPPGRLRGKVKKGGIDPAWYAEAYGFRSVKQMVDTIVKAPTLKEAADQAAEARMIDKYGDILNDGRLELEAREAVTNEEQAKLLIMEIRALNKKAPTIDREYLKARAKDTIEGLKYKEIKPDKYDRARIKAAMKAATAETKAEAIKFKTQQLVNHYLYKEALKARDRMAKQRRYVKATQTRSYEGKNIDPMYIQNMVSLANLYFMKDRVAQQGELDKLINWFQSQINDPNQFVELLMLDPNLIAAIDAKERGELALFQPPHFDDLTSGELQGLYDMLRHMRFVGGKLAGEAKSEIAQKIAAIAESIAINSKKTAKQRGVPGAAEDWSRKLKVFVNKIPSLRNLTRMLDGFDDNGIMYREVYREIEDAANKKLKLSNDIYKRFENEMNGIHKIGLSRSNKKDYTLQNGERLSLDSEHRFMMALYWGTESSRDAIRDGFGVTDTDVLNILNDLTDEQLDFVNATWRVNESMWPALSEVGVKISGVAPPKLDPAPFYVRGKKMTGGHMRLFYDSQEIELKQAREATTNMSKIMPTKAGSLNARVGSGGRKPALDKNNIVRSINENVHYIAFAPASEKIKALVNAKDVKAAIGATYSEEWYKAFIENIDHITNNRHERTSFEFAAKLSRLTRKALTFKYLAYSIRNTMQQFSAIPIAMQEVGMPEFTWRIMNFAASPMKSMEYVTEKSTFMRNRMDLVNREASEYLKKVTATSELQKVWNTFTQYGFVPQTVVDAIISYPVWTATYEKAIQEGVKEKDAVSKADSAVAESVGSGSDLHLGGLFASTQDEWTKTLTVFGSWFNAYYQRMYKSSKGFTDFRNKDAFMTMVTTPLVVGVLSAALVMDIPEEKDDEEFSKTVSKWIAKQYFSFMAGTVPLLRDLWASMTGFAPKNAYTSLMEAPENMKSVIESMFDPESKVTPLKQVSRMTKAATTVVPVPGSGNLTRLLDYIDSYQQGNEGTTFNYYQALTEGQERNK